ncbi:MAG: DUF488 family protein [Hyphomicrobium sp.]|jgi:uncharacterized protein YeaO (DUF488 family)|nr:DUF488 family protein [Hyphomicrobium sp.]
MTVFLKRAYAPPAAEDGMRVLVDRLWPRGLSKDEARIDIWMKEIAPSTALRRWFNHDPAKWQAFQQKYIKELEGSAALDELRRLVRRCRITLLFAARDEEHNNAVVLQSLLKTKTARARRSP